MRRRPASIERSRRENESPVFRVRFHFRRKERLLPPRRSVPSQERPGTKPAAVRFPLPHPLPAEGAARSRNRQTPHFVSPHGRDSDLKPQDRTTRHGPHSRKCKPPRRCGPSGEPAPPVAGIRRCAHGFGKRAPSETSPRLRPKNRTVPVPTGIIVFPRTPRAGRPRHSFRPFPTTACNVWERFRVRAAPNIGKFLLRTTAPSLLPSRSETKKQGRASESVGHPSLFIYRRKPRTGTTGRRLLCYMP